MPDIADIANATVERDTLQAIEVCRGDSRLDRPSRSYCFDCEEPIPEARRQKMPGCQRCIDCQETFETITDHWRPT